MTKLQVKERPKLSCDVWTSNRQIICESAQTRLHIKSPPCLFIKKSVLSLARSNFLTGAIINTRFQASLLAPPEMNIRTSVCNVRHANGMLNLSEKDEVTEKKKIQNSWETTVVLEILNAVM